MKNVAILGSTGSIGKQALDVVRSHPDRFALYGVSAHSSEEAFLALLRAARPRRAVFSRPLSETVPGVALSYGVQALCELAADPQVDVVVLAISGIAALVPLLSALKAGKRVAIANKESLVCGGDLVKEALQQGGGELLPVDSEQSAIFQCLENGRREEVEKLILTASGGPFYGKKFEEMETITKEDALRHPNWTMGPKITVDSATMMNKGLEVIEAMRLYRLPKSQVDVVVHRQSIVHSLVEFRDGAILAQLGVPDMRIPIQLALTYPNRMEAPCAALDLLTCGELTFLPPDPVNFPCLAYAVEAAQRGGTACAIMNGANEAAVDLFLHDRIGFNDIPRRVRRAMDTVAVVDRPGLEDILAADRLARDSVYAG